MGIKLSHLPLRLATGAFLVNSGMTKLSLPEEEAKTLHELAAERLPGVDQVSPALFGRVLAVGELALGSALLVPLVPAGVAGAALGAFSGGLLWLYAKTPAMHEEASLRPTPQGLVMAKDVWMAGIAASLVIDDAGRRLRRRLSRAKRQSAGDARGQ
jgi:uncharacterized membrane protein YphA (DoxX/SURF4 family)